MLLRKTIDERTMQVCSFSVHVVKLKKTAIHTIVNRTNREATSTVWSNRLDCCSLVESVTANVRDDGEDGEGLIVNKFGRKEIEFDRESPPAILLLPPLPSSISSKGRPRSCKYNMMMSAPNAK
jgi:hypothetical protein